ncbi:MAG: hypothetical protein QMD71_08615 [bacterium]|nr:hypothetical protein [bacterium]
MSTGCCAKKWLPFLVVVGAFLLFGCAPKGASKEILSSLEQAKLSAESAESKAKAIESQRIELELKKADKIAKVTSLEVQLSELKAKKKK